MKCKCGGTTRNLATRATAYYISRRRECKRCRIRFSTREVRTEELLLLRAAMEQVRKLTTMKGLGR
jgi:transcriptional regulator NrdR family protein